MIIKVCGLREPDNIREVLQAGVDWIGMVFHEESPRNVTMIPTHAGIIPDRGKQLVEKHQTVQRVGVFTDEMPQNIITRVVNFALDIVQLDGNETPTLVSNLKATLVPDIQPLVRMMKSITIASPEDIACCKPYVGCIDLFRFVLTDIKLLPLLGGYDCRQPFLIAGPRTMVDVAALRSFRHPQFLGVDLDEGFETAPAVKDVARLRNFIKELRSQ